MNPSILYPPSPPWGLHASPEGLRKRHFENFARLVAVPPLCFLCFGTARLLVCRFLVGCDLIPRGEQVQLVSCLWFCSRAWRDWWVKTLVKLFLQIIFSEELLLYFVRLKVDALSVGVDLDFVSMGTTDWTAHSFCSAVRKRHVLSQKLF